MEQLRYVARSRGGPVRIATEAAWALGDLIYWVEPQGLVPACRRLVEWHPTSGPLWDLAVRVLAAGDPAAEARIIADELAGDTTADELAAALDEGARVRALGGDTWRRVRSLRPDLREIRSGRADVFVVEVAALGGPGAVAPGGAAAAISAARSAPVWAVAPTGTVVSELVWDRIVARSAEREDVEVVERERFDHVVGPGGLESWSISLCRAAPEVPPPTLR